MIAIVDYGLGNIRAFANVSHRLNLPCVVASRPEELRDATRVVLPGVGAFDEAMGLLARSGLRDPLEELVLGRKVPLLGICVGMQMLARSSEEGRLPGLGWIDGEVRRFEAERLVHKPRLPHMGWNRIIPKAGVSLLAGMEGGARFYFLHSYYFRCRSEADSISETDYGGRFTSAVGAGNIYGVQLHPEKSHHDGVRLLRNFGTL